MPEPQRARVPALDWGDAVVCGVLVAGTILYLQQWPRDLNAFDEGLFLYEAVRLLSGDVMYRDFFEVAAPAPFYAMAFFFSLFGADIETARAVMVGLHAVIVAVLYVTCRLVAVRRSLAALCAAVHPALFFAIFPIATPHWCGTLLVLIALAVAVRGSVGSPRRAALLGIVLGFLLLSQHHKAPLLGGGIALLVFVDAWRARRSDPRAAGPFACLLACGAAALAVALPPMLALLAAAGPRRVYEVMIRYPLAQYRGYVEHQGWGYFPWLEHAGFSMGYRELTIVYLVKYMPAAALVVAGATLYRARAGAPAHETRSALVVVLFAAVACLSVVYNPDFIHLGIIGPLWIVPIALLLEWAGAALQRSVAPLRWAAPAVPAALAVVLAWQLSFNLAWRRSYYPHSHDTAFGRIDFHDPDEIAVVDALSERAATAPSRELFVFPAYAALYLMTATINPTPYQILVAGYSVPGQYEEIIDILERRKVPFVAYSPFAVRPRKNPVVQYLMPRYERVPLSSQNRLPIVLLYQRKEADAGG